MFDVCDLLTINGNTTLLDCTTPLRTCRNKTCFDQHGNKVNGSFFCEVFISQFNKTIDQGLRILGDMEEEMKAAGEKTLSGENAFKLYDTY